MDLGGITAVSECSIGDLFSDGGYLRYRLIGHQDNIGVFHVLSGLHGKSILFFSQGNLHILCDIIPVKGNFETVLINEEIIFRGKLIFNDHIFCDYGISFLGHTDGVCHGLAIIIDLLIRTLLNLRIGRIRGNFLIISDLQGFIGYCSCDVFNLFSCQVFIRYHHLILNDHLRLCSNGTAGILLSFRVPGLQGFRILFPIQVIAVMLLILHQVFLCGKDKCIVIDFGFVGIVFFFYDISFRIHEDDRCLLQLHTLCSDHIIKYQVPGDGAFLAVDRSDGISDRIANFILLTVCFLCDHKTGGIDIDFGICSDDHRISFFILHHVLCRCGSSVDDLAAVYLLLCRAVIINGQFCSFREIAVRQLPSIPGPSQSDNGGTIFRFIIFVFIDLIGSVLCPGNKILKYLTVSAVSLKLRDCAIGRRLCDPDVIII